MIREHNRLDLELYEFGKGLFEEKPPKERGSGPGRIGCIAYVAEAWFGGGLL